MTDDEFLALFPLPEGVSLFSITHRERDDSDRWSIFAAYRYDYRAPDGANYIGVNASGRGPTLAAAHTAVRRNILLARERTDAQRAAWAAQVGAERAKARAITIDLSDLGL